MSSEWVLAFLDPWFYRKQHGSMEGYGPMSGLPIIGGILVGAAGALMPESVVLGSLFLVLYFIDGNGIPWVLLSFLRDGI